MLKEKTQTGVLQQILQTERRQIRAITNAWVSAGAESFGILDEDGNILKSWNFDADESEDILCADIISGTQLLGQLTVSGIVGDIHQARLETDAAMIARLCSFEADINNVVAELIDAQDQILALYKLTQSLKGLLNHREIMEVFTRETCQLIEVESAFMILGSTAKTTVQHPAEFVPVSLLHIALEIVEKDKQELHISQPDILRGVNNLYLIPIMVRGEMIAGLGLVNKKDGFTSPDIKKARAIAVEAGAQIEKVLLYQETLSQAKLRTELDMAADIQTRLLPQQVPSLNGLDIAGASIQARQVGGDFFDYIIRLGQPFIFVVGDVAGKGMSSALLMAMTRIVMRSHANIVTDPAGIITLANSDLYDDYTGVSKFTTAFIGTYLPETGEMRIANAGHSPVIYCPFDDAPRLLQANDMPLGILPDNEFTSEKITFRPDDLLVVATDGFSEATNKDGELFGYDRLLSLIKSVSQESAESVMKTLFDTIQQFSEGTEQADDQTMVVIKGKQHDQD